MISLMMKMKKQKLMKVINMTTEAKNLYNFLKTVHGDISDIDRAYCDSRGNSCNSCPLNFNKECLTTQARVSIDLALNALREGIKDDEV
jgi:hypothetical protein